MEITQDVQKLLEQLERNSRRQLAYARIQCVFSVLAAVCCLALALAVIRFVPQAELLAAQIQELATQTQGLAAQAETVLSNLETASASLAQADLSGMVSNVDTLVKDSQEGLGQALEAINSIDIEALNTAIANLSAVVEPLASFFGRLR